MVLARGASEGPNLSVIYVFSIMFHFMAAHPMEYIHVNMQTL